VHLEQENVFPLIISATLEKWDADLPTGSVDRSVAIIEKMESDLEYGRFARIFVDEPALVRTLAQVPFMRALGQRVWVDRAEIAFELTSTAFCRLSYGYYPGLDIRLDGRPAEYFRTTDGFIGMEIPAGRHRIDISGQQSPLRKALLIVNVILMIATIYWVYQIKRTRTRGLNGR
jgi:hypothetical protein